VIALRIFRGACFVAVLTVALSVFGAPLDQQLPPADGTHSVWRLLLHCALFGGLGIILVIVGFKVFDWVITKIDLEDEINKGNVAAAILSAAAIIAISFIVAAAIH